MKTNIFALEKRINGILEYLDSLEVENKPLSDSFNSFVKYAHDKFINEDNGKIREERDLMNFMNEYKYSQIKYEEGMHNRMYGWKRVIEDRFSKIIEEEIGISEEDIATIKKPFGKLVYTIGTITELSELINEMGFNFLVGYNDREWSIEQFLKRLKENRCVQLSFLYASSLDCLTKLTEMQVESPSELMINKRFFENIFMPLLKLRGKSEDERKMKKEFENDGKLIERMHELDISREKRFLIRNILNIDDVYSGVRKRYASLSEYLETDLNLGSKTFFSKESF